MNHVESVKLSFKLLMIGKQSVPTTTRWYVQTWLHHLFVAFISKICRLTIVNTDSEWNSIRNIQLHIERVHKIGLEECVDILADLGCKGQIIIIFRFDLNFAKMFLRVI